MTNEMTRSKKKNLLDNLTNGRRYRELKEEAEDKKKVERQFITGT